MDNHLIVDGKRLDASTPGFGRLYGWSTLATTNAYVGHQLESGRRECLLRTPEESLNIRPNHYVVMGDNTRNSQDSRYFGDFSREYVIGKAAFVYWPFTQRFFCGYKSGE
jgi:signal peptidase I